MEECQTLRQKLKFIYKRLFEEILSITFQDCHWRQVTSSGVVAAFGLVIPRQLVIISSTVACHSLKWSLAEAVAAAVASGGRYCR
jgi:hypothetical protein